MPQESEPGSAGSHETALKKFLSVSELALGVAATYILARAFSLPRFCVMALSWLKSFFGQA
jgi:hypothetical protein